MTQDSLTDEVSEDLPLDLAKVKTTFVGMNTWIEEAPRLGEEVKFTVSGYVRKRGREHLESKPNREFVQIEVTSIDPL